MIFDRCTSREYRHAAQFMYNEKITVNKKLTSFSVSQNNVPYHEW